jgi:purine-binding chemotaxis protein CheW
MEESLDTMENLYIIFFIDGKEYGIEIRYLIEIIAFQPITFIPNLPHYVKGVINLRGKIIPVLDVRLRFGIAPLDYTENTCILILNFNNLKPLNVWSFDVTLNPKTSYFSKDLIY